MSFEITRGVWAFSSSRQVAESYESKCFYECLFACFIWRAVKGSNALSQLTHTQKCKILTYWQALHPHKRTHTHTRTHTKQVKVLIQWKEEMITPLLHTFPTMHTLLQSKSPQRAGLWFIILHSHSTTLQFSTTAHIILFLICTTCSRMSV